MSFDISQYTVPTRPGCYLYKDSKGTVIYVGKAKNLRNRVKSYFHAGVSDPKTQLLVSRIRDVEFITTNNEVEALLLEQSLIHRYSPKFNIDLKGSVRYAYIKITDETFPRIVTSRKVDGTGTYYGPYTDGTARRQIIGALVKLFKIRTCVKMPRKACLQYHLGNCQAPCEELVSAEEYGVNIANAHRLLKGEASELIADVQERMRVASRERRFEIAKIYRDQLEALSYVQDKQFIDQAKAQDQDVINWKEYQDKLFIQVFNVVRGVITSRHRFTIDAYEGALEDFITHYYSIHYIPQEIILPRHLADEEVIIEYLRTTKQQKFALQYAPKMVLTAPRKGVKKELLQLVADNIDVAVGYDPAVLELQKKLQLLVAPVTIDFFDISNLKNQYIVGAVIQLMNGQFHKNGYRKFKIRSQQAQDDFAAMQEVVFRRYRRMMAQHEPLPDLIIIDGGRGQLNAALVALAQLQLQIPICGLAKRKEELYLPGKPAPLRLNKQLPGLRMLIKGRDEVHRFVLKYNRKLRTEIFGT